MRFIYFLLFLVLPITSYAQATPVDSVSVRVYNRAKFYLKRYSIIIDDKRYSFEDVPKDKYSAFKKLPYVYDRNTIEVQIIRKRFLQYDEWVTMSTISIDHIGDKRIDSGLVTVNVSTKRKHHRMIIDNTLK